MPNSSRSKSTRPAGKKSRPRPRKPSPVSRKKAIKEPQEFPISHSMLRQMYDSMIESRLWAQSKGFAPVISEATAVPAALALKGTDILAAPADGKTLYPIAQKETSILAYDPDLLRKSLQKLRSKHRHAIALALLTETAFDSDSTADLLAEAHENLWPIVFIVLTDRAFDPAASVVEIDVDGHDAVAVFRVVSEAIRRARNGRGPAVIHAHGSTGLLSAETLGGPLARFQAYLNAKGLSTERIHVLHHEGRS